MAGRGVDWRETSFRTEPTQSQSLDSARTGPVLPGDSPAPVPENGASAQGTTWIVDAANGPNTDFTTLIDAEAAASDGDTLIVRPGQHTGFDTIKGLILLDAPTSPFDWPRIEPSSSDDVTTVGISNLAADQAFRIERMEIRGPTETGLFGLSAAVRVEDCVGAVHLEDIEIVMGSFDRSAGISIDKATQFSVNGSRLFGRPAVYDIGDCKSTIVDSFVLY